MSMFFQLHFLCFYAITIALKMLCLRLLSCNEIKRILFLAARNPQTNCSLLEELDKGEVSKDYFILPKIKDLCRELFSCLLLLFSNKIKIVRMRFHHCLKVTRLGIVTLFVPSQVGKNTINKCSGLAAERRPSDILAMERLFTAIDEMKVR